MNRHHTIAVTLLLSALAVGVAGVTAGCSSEPGHDASAPTEAPSKAASPIVQQGGVTRYRAETAGNVTRVALLDEAGDAIGTLEIVTDSPQHVRAKQTLRGRAFEASWSEESLTFAREGQAAITVRPGETREGDVDRALRDATSDLNVALGLARDVGAYSLVARDATSSIRPLDLSSGGQNPDRYVGYDWEWGTSAGSWNGAYNASQVSAYNGCMANHSSGGCATYQGATMQTTCSSSYYYVSCSTTLTVAPCASTGNCPQ